MANALFCYIPEWSWLCFYQTRSAWSMDQGSNRKHSAVHNFAPTVTKFCVMWEGQALPHDTKFSNCRCEIVGRRVIFIWSLIPGSSWSGLIKAEPDCSVCHLFNGMIYVGYVLSMLHCTVETLYNTVNFCWSTHKRHSIARPKGRGMGCLLWVQRATYCVDLSKLSSIKYLL